MHLAIRDPTLVVLIGAAGAGKSTFAARHFAREEVLSSDALRARISGDEADQTVTQVAFAVLHRALAARLASGRTTVVDATNVTRFARRGLLRRASAARVPAVAVILDLPTDVVLHQNAARPGRIVPERAVLRQLAELRRTLRGDLVAEGFDAALILRTREELEGFRIARSRDVVRSLADPEERASNDLHPDSVHQVRVVADDLERLRLRARADDHHRSAHVREGTSEDDRP